MLGLHHGSGDVEGLQVVNQVAAVGRLFEPATQFCGVVRRQLKADFFSQLDDCLRAKTSVEVIVQRDLWQLLDVHFKP